MLNACKLKIKCLNSVHIFNLSFVALDVNFAKEVLALLLFEIEHVDLAIRLVLHEVKTNDLVDKVHPKTAILLKRIEEKEAEEGSPQRVRQRTYHLNAQLLTITCVKEPSLLVEYPSRDNGPDTAESVHLADIKRVVDLEAADQLLGLSVYRTPDDANRGGSP